MKKSKKKNIKVHDLKPKKDAKGGAYMAYVSVKGQKSGQDKGNVK